MKTNMRNVKNYSKNSLSKKQTKILSPKTIINKGDNLILEINALSSKNRGLSELANGYTVIIPKAELGDQVKVQIEKVFSGKLKYATAKVIELLKKGENSSIFKVGEILNVKITKTGPKNTGLAQMTDKFTLIVPKTKINDEVSVKIIKIKQNYGFAKVVHVQTMEQRKQALSSFLNNLSLNKLTLGSKFNIILPPTAKSDSKYAVIKLKGHVVFIKKELGVKLGDPVRIQIVKVNSEFAIAKIKKIYPLSTNQNHKLTKHMVKKMVQTGMHFGEKKIRCHANMRKFLWIQRKGKNSNKPLIKRGRYLINLLKTRRCLNSALKQLAKYASKGKTFLFVGTKKPAAALIARTAMLSQTSFFVNTRWLGGMLTNWKTILKSISQIRPILKEKQKILQNIVEKRQKIKARLINKINFLRKKSQKLMTKGKLLITQIKQNRRMFIEKSQKLIDKKNQMINKNELIIKKYSELSLKKQQILKHSQELQQTGNQLIQQKSLLKKQLLNNRRKLNEFQQLFLIGQELNKIQKAIQDQNKDVWMISYGKISKIIKHQENQNWLIPHPPKQLLNKIINSMKIKYDLNSNGELSSNSSNTDISNLLNSNRPKLEHSEKNTLVLSKLLNKFTRFLPFIKIYIKTLVLRVLNTQTLLKNVNENIQVIQQKLSTYQILITKLNSDLNLIKTKLIKMNFNFKNLKLQLRKLAAEQKLLKFLPRLRYLPTPKNKVSEIVELLMKKFVDPKMSYPMDQIYDQKLKLTSKKMAAARKQKWQRLEKYFGGVTKMAKLSKKQISNNVAIIVGQQEEMNAVRECKKLGIKMFTIVDTNCNPRLSDYIIPANDDSRNSIKFVLGEMLTHIRLAQKLRTKIVSQKLQTLSVKK